MTDTTFVVTDAQRQTHDDLQVTFEEALLPEPPAEMLAEVTSTFVRVLPNLGPAQIAVVLNEVVSALIALGNAFEKATGHNPSTNIVNPLVLRVLHGVADGLFMTDWMDEMFALDVESILSDDDDDEGFYDMARDF